ncbi:hypothetical protein ABZY58_11530 [Micromonospora tulbaghiae]|uniref:hypothetical protein n=1 Tax=Micromonospora tulbaghiae TaxID=479978 RepID=UPI0033B89FDE
MQNPTPTTTDQPAPHVVTVVATLDLGNVPPAAVEAEIRATLARLGARLVPCGWAPDPDTIADCTGADRVDVLDLNPNRI